MALHLNALFAAAMQGLECLTFENKSVRALASGRSRNLDLVEPCLETDASRGIALQTNDQQVFRVRSEHLSSQAVTIRPVFDARNPFVKIHRARITRRFSWGRECQREIEKRQGRTKGSRMAEQALFTKSSSLNVVTLKEKLADLPKGRYTSRVDIGFPMRTRPHGRL